VRVSLPDPLEAVRILGIGIKATDEDVRAAYLRLVRKHPPDRDPEVFEKVRDAYETLRDPERRAALALLAGDPDAPLASVLDGASERHFVGPGPWWAAFGRRK